MITGQGRIVVGKGESLEGRSGRQVWERKVEPRVVDQMWLSREGTLECKSSGSGAGIWILEVIVAKTRTSLLSHASTYGEQEIL